MRKNIISLTIILLIGFAISAEFLATGERALCSDPNDECLCTSIKANGDSDCGVKSQCGFKCINCNALLTHGTCAR